MVLSKHAKLIGDRYGIDVRVEIKGQKRLPLQHRKGPLPRGPGGAEQHRQARQSDRGDHSALHTGRQGRPEDQGQWRGLRDGVTKPNTLGLTSMRERVEQLGGTFQIGPNPSGQGTLVAVDSALR